MYQGRAEAGPRALGNRSILYDPTDPNGKAYVNTVKGREWFRPFAGSVLKEFANDWFDMAGMDESPHMMYAVDVQADKVDKIPNITHVDDTCRIQTVTHEQNKHYYELISEFNTNRSRRKSVLNDLNAHRLAGAQHHAKNAFYVVVCQVWITFLLDFCCFIEVLDRDSSR